MTAASPAQAGLPTHGGLHRRPDRRRRLVEKVLAAVLLLVAFLVTVVLLGLQWLGTQSSSGSAPPPATRSFTSEVHTS